MDYHTKQILLICIDIHTNRMKGDDDDDDQLDVKNDEHDEYHYDNCNTFI